MTTVPKENLDERIERIRKRNEEIEKKYREAEEDRKMALKENAMVLMTAPKEQDWPKAHKFDKLDFTYDVKPDKLEKQPEEMNSDKPVSVVRDFKKFADGEGPPPDPAYNFLADAERDWRPELKSDKKDTRLPKNEAMATSKRGGPQNNSFRNRNNEKNPVSSKFQKQNSHPEYESWRSERKRIDDARVSRQKVGDKWRREWDNDKVNNSENDAMLKPERSTLGDAFTAVNQNGTKKSPTHTAKPHHNSYGHTGNDGTSEKRSNISVTVSSSGEVKSVKLTTAPVIGTGRVGPRQVSKPQFEIQSFELDKMSISQTPNSPRARQSDKGLPKYNNQNISNLNQQKANPYIKKHQHSNRNNENLIANGKNTPITAWMPLKDSSDIPIAQNCDAGNLPDSIHRSDIAKKSVQDRLTRIRQKQPASEIVASTLKDAIVIDTNEIKNIAVDDIQAQNPITA